MFRFDDFEFSTEGPLLTRSGEAVALEPQALRLLEVLLMNRDRIVSKDELIADIWDGRAITDAALNTRVRAVRRALGDSATEAKYIKTFPKRGFQFVAPVAEGSLQASDIARRSQVPPALLAVMIVGIAALLLAAFLTVFDSQGDIEVSEQPSLAVVSFENLSGDTDDTYFADGLADDVSAQLSRYRELFVVSRATMMAFADDGASPAVAARELGVAYLVTGSMRRNDDRIRLIVELVDTEDQKIVWSNTFDLHLTDIFEVQEDMSSAIAGALLPEIQQADVVKIEGVPTEDLGAWDIYLRGRSAQSVFSKDAQLDAVQHARAAIDRDPDFAGAHSLLARALGTIFFFGWAEDPQDTLITATDAAKKAIALDALDAQAHAALGYLYRFTGEADAAIANLERAVVLNPNDARIRLELAHTLDWFRFQEKALPEVNLALQLSPRDPLLQNMYFYKGHILFHLNRHEEALETATNLGAVATSKTWQMYYHLLRAANLAQLGRENQAQEAVDAALALNPNLSITAMKRQFAGAKNHPDNRRIWLASLQKAGVPE